MFPRNHQFPGDACHLVGQRHGGQLRRLAFEELGKPRRRPAAASNMLDHGGSPDHQHAAQSFIAGSKHRSPGRPRVDKTIEGLIVRMAEENLFWGYDRIVGSLANLGYEVSDQTVGNILRRHGVSPAPERKRSMTWAAFIRAHLAVLAGTDFFTVEVLTPHLNT